MLESLSRPQRILVKTILFIAGGYLLLAFPFGFYVRYSPACSGKVLDEETMKPIAGAGVMMHFEMFAISPGGPVRAGTRDVISAITDENGEFSFWPRLIFKLPSVWYYLDNPELYVIAPGYVELHMPGYPKYGKILISGKMPPPEKGSIKPTNNMAILLHKRGNTIDENCNRFMQLMIPPPELRYKVKEVIDIVEREIAYTGNRCIDIKYNRMSDTK